MRKINNQNRKHWKKIKENDYQRSLFILIEGFCVSLVCGQERKFWMTNHISSLEKSSMFFFCFPQTCHEIPLYSVFVLDCINSTELDQLTRNFLSFWEAYPICSLPWKKYAMFLSQQSQGCNIWALELYWQLRIHKSSTYKATWQINVWNLEYRICTLHGPYENGDL